MYWWNVYDICYDLFPFALTVWDGFTGHTKPQDAEKSYKNDEISNIINL